MIAYWIAAGLSTLVLPLIHAADTSAAPQHRRRGLQRIPQPIALAAVALVGAIIIHTATVIKGA